MAKHIENIVVGIPLISPSEIFAIDLKDWEENEIQKTEFTNEKFLPMIQLFTENNGALYATNVIFDLCWLDELKQLIDTAILKLKK